MAKVKVKITDKDKGWSKIVATTQALKKNPHVVVGIQGETGMRPKVQSSEGGSFSPLTGGLSLVEVAAIHEFGAPGANIPERSFIRSTHDENKESWVKAVRSLKEQILLGKVTLDVALDRLGLKIKSDIQKKIRSNIPPPLQHRDGTALIDTGQLINSIVYKKVIDGAD